MKTIILSSGGSAITDFDLNPFLSKNILDCKIAYITTASKKVPDITYVEKHREKMNARGWNYTEMDIEGKNEKELREMFAGYDVILVEGGNTFFLIKVIRESGFERVIKNLLAQGVIYMASSAGSYVACPSMMMAKWSGRGFEEFGITDFTGMGLVDFCIKAHYTPDDFERMLEKSKELEYPLYLLENDQVMVVRDDRIEFIGPREVKVLN